MLFISVPVVGFLVYGAYSSPKVFRRSWVDIAIALLVLFYFGTMASGLLPTHLYISTESHIAGAIAGVIYAWLSKKVIRYRPNNFN